LHQGQPHGERFAVAQALQAGYFTRRQRGFTTAQVGLA
jgi:hypothetical protein